MKLIQYFGALSATHSFGHSKPQKLLLLPVTSSRLKSTPPIGAPNATETPAAAAAESTCKAKVKDGLWEL